MRNVPTGTHTAAEEKDEWRTPQAIVQLVQQRYGCSIDLACTKANAVFPHCLTRTDDALTGGRWGHLFPGGVGFANPPYSDLDPWFAMAHAEAHHNGFSTVILAPSPNGERRHVDHALGICTEIVFVQSRIAFLRPDGRPVKGNTRGSCLYYWRAFDLGHTRYSVL